jgi:hypothetical protein
MAGKLSGNAIIDETITAGKMQSSVNDILNGNVAGGGILVTEVIYPDASNTASIFGRQTVTLIGSGFDESSNVYMNGVISPNTTYINATAISFETVNVFDASFPFVNPNIESRKDYFVHVINSDGTTYELSPPLSVRNGFVYNNYGYVSGGVAPPSPTVLNTIDKFPFATDANATDVGDLTQARFDVAGQSSFVSGYSTGGLVAPIPSPNPVSNTIDKFPFASDANATDVGDLSQSRAESSGSSSSTRGFTFGGYGRTPPTTIVSYNTIDSFPFATNSNASDRGDLNSIVTASAAASSLSFTYVHGGESPTPAPAPTIGSFQKFSLVSQSYSSIIPTASTRARHGAAQSQSHAYYFGGRTTPSTTTANIMKFPFAAENATSSVGNLTVTRIDLSGHSSLTNGYSSGGSPASNVIDKFPFASDANATDVGDLTQARLGVAGQEY